MANITILCGSVFGSAQNLAELVKTKLIAQSHTLTLNIPCSIADMDTADAVLVISSTTGQGDLPGNIEAFYFDAKSTMPLFSGKPFGVIALGDSSYPTYCGAGDKMQELFFELQGQETLPMIKIDAIETLEPETIALSWLEEWVEQL
jgi:MioC protein